MGGAFCSQRRINAIVWSTLRLFWRFSVAILTSFCVDTQLWTKHGYTTTLQRQRNNQNSGFLKANGLRRRRRVKTAGKVMATVFWDARGIIYTDYLEKGQTITGAYYASLLHRLSDEIKKKSPYLKKKKILFHQDNARVHTCAVSMTKVMELKFELLQHSQYFFHFQT